MAKAKRPAEASTDDLELFASFVRAEERKVRDDKRAAKEQRRAEGEHQRLVHAKDAAAAEVKRLRGSERATAEQKAAADDAYKAALAALVAHETGTAPTWAPPSDDAPAEPATAEDQGSSAGAESARGAPDGDEPDAAIEVEVEG